MSVVSFHGVSLILAGHRILDKVDWQIQPQERIALVGRNGAGKSTLLKLLHGELTHDEGNIHCKQGLRIAGLTQTIPFSDKETVYHFLVKGLGADGDILAHYHDLLLNGSGDELMACQTRLDDRNLWSRLPQIETMASHLGLDCNASMKHLSGGMKRRALLAASLIAEPDLLLLDEPTNHLDIDAIEWLESYLKQYTKSYLVVTHDREFLAQVATKIVEIDRGKLHVFACDYPTYLERREAIRNSEQKQDDLFDKRLGDEETWIRTGVKARRTRNEGRVRALKAMREAYKQRRNEMGSAKTMVLDVARSGQLVLEANEVSYGYNDTKLLNNFSFLLSRGDKIGILGTNGCGKTTLLRLLMGDLMPDSGSIRQGTSLAVAYFDQLRSELDETKTLLANVADGVDFVTINGQSKHVASYLRDFLFSPSQFNQPVSTLSGGERNRLLLAKLLAKPVNLLIMDEPTNDLDMETLDLLESMLVDYKGTLLLVSHDRAFINNVVTSILIHEEDGAFHEYVGDYNDYRRYKKSQPVVAKPSSEPVKIQTNNNKPKSNKLSFNEERELSQLTQTIESLENLIVSLQAEMAESSFYERDNQARLSFQQALLAHESTLNSHYARWETLEAKRYAV